MLWTLALVNTPEPEGVGWRCAAGTTVPRRVSCRPPAPKDRVGRWGDRWDWSTPIGLFSGLLVVTDQRTLWKVTGTLSMLHPGSQHEFRTLGRRISVEFLVQAVGFVQTGVGNLSQDQRAKFKFWFRVNISVVLGWIRGRKA